ncbi:hypothetical protein AS159_00145 [Thermotoga sp. Ku-13t]|nr:hypothetical protein AS159_00145 [Thermotoga sp. Ku-13t]
MESLSSELVSDDAGLYVHVPFCRSRCRYCDFVSYTDFSLVDEYFKALWREIELWTSLLPEVRVGSIYFGGGSPSDIPFELLEKTVDLIAKRFRLKSDIEFTVEVNPNCGFPVEKLKLLGVNRVSVGLQAADDSVLQRVRRRHTVSDFFKVFESAKSFAKVNVDFIVGLPGESDRTIDEDVCVVERLKPDHVSIYLLEIHEPDLNQPPCEEVEARYERFVESVQSIGYLRYEISNFALNGNLCRHNLKYWRNEDYIGLGIAAGGHLGRIRYVNTSKMVEYVSQIWKKEFAFEYFSENDELQELKESLFMGLRLREGISVERLRSLCPAFDLEVLFSDLLGELLQLEDGFLRLTEKGFDLSARVLADVIDRISSIAVGR